MRLDANLVPRSYAAFVAWNRTCTICASGLSVHTGACCHIVLECVDCLWDKCCIRFGNEARLRDQAGHTWCVSSFLSRKNPRVQWWAHQEPQPPIRDNTTDRQTWSHSFVTSRKHTQYSCQDMKLNARFQVLPSFPDLATRYEGWHRPHPPRTGGRISHHTRILIIAT